MVTRTDIDFSDLFTSATLRQYYQRNPIYSFKYYLAMNRVPENRFPFSDFALMRAEPRGNVTSCVT